jgi:phosphomannomutase
LYKFKELKGKVVYSFSVTNKLKKLADHFGLASEETKIGFKYIGEIMINEDVLLGGEESGGIAVKGHIPERDGIWVGLTIMEFMAKTGKSLVELIKDIYDITGSFSYDRDDLHLSNSDKTAIIEKCKKGKITKIGDRPIIKTQTIDGFKFIISEDEWVMVRPSGTEPVLRIYAQASNADSVRRLLDDTHTTLKA